MRRSLYPKLAWESIRKNKKMYLPYMLTCIGMVAMYYIVTALGVSPAVMHMKGGSNVRMMLNFGSWVIALFSLIFLFYTNSFLMRRRKKEIGLYNILGMGKGNIGRILFWETLMIAVISVAVGMIAGTLLCKLAELLLVRLLNGDVTYGLYIAWDVILSGAAIYGVIFLLILIKSLLSVRINKPVELLHSEQVGEKPPKANWVLGIAGAAILGTAYYLAVSIDNPVQALSMFFVAVILVIVGTYLLFICGSVLLCKLLQKNKKYYYDPRHFVSVSSMQYRMKRNGAGLASICILATMVLVILSSTTCLYFGAEDSITSMYPRDIKLKLYMKTMDGMEDDIISEKRADVARIMEHNGITDEDLLDYRFAQISGKVTNGKVETDVRNVEDSTNLQDVRNLYFVPLEDYNRMTGENRTLQDGEALLFPYSCVYDLPELSVRGGSRFRVAEKLDEFFGACDLASEVIPSIVLIVPDFQKAMEPMETFTDFTGMPMLTKAWEFAFDTAAAEENQSAFVQEMGERITDGYMRDDSPVDAYYFDTMTANRIDFYSTYGGFFFLGITLSVVFLFATVLIIYYKQVTEGYEDRARFTIMQNVGMTKKDIRRSIHSQMLTVFLLPMAFAVMHIAFAFPMIRKMLLLFSLNNTQLLIMTAVISVLAFSAVYMIVYRITSGAYYSIVSTGEHKE